MLQLNGIAVSFQDRAVFKDLSCRVESGDFITIVGPNGAGKTTLFDLISGKTAPDKGAVIFNGTDITSLNEFKRALWIGRMFQNTHMGSAASMTVAENLCLATCKGRRIRFASGTKAFPKTFLAELEQFLDIEISAWMHKTMGSLSGGQRQLITFLMALMVRPRILLLDEPTAALDPSSAQKLLQCMQSFIQNEKMTTLMITHDPKMAILLGNKMWILRNGGLEEKTGADIEGIQLS